MEEIINMEFPKMNPYTRQMERFSKSLKHLSQLVTKLEPSGQEFTSRELVEIYEQIDRKVCLDCENRAICRSERKEQVLELISLILETVEHYGIELNVEVKRKLQRDCVMAPRFLRETIDVFGNYKQIFIWNHRLLQNRKTYALEMDTFADVLNLAAQEMDDSVLTETFLEKKLQKALEKTGIRYLDSTILIQKSGRYQVYLTIKAMQEMCVPVEEVARILSACMDKKMEAVNQSSLVVGKMYQCFLFQEAVCFYTLSGISRIGKRNNKISGDSFALIELPGGRQAAILSDGMGAGVEAFRESSQVVEMLEELLEAGFPVETAVSMINIAMVIGREEVRFSTVDLLVIDLYTGEGTFLKAGAAASFVKRGGELFKIQTDSLPLGVSANLKSEQRQMTLEPGDVIIMISDGVVDSMPVKEQEFLLETILKGTNDVNPKSLSEHIMQQMLQLGAALPEDDMSVLAVGIWER